MLRRCLSLMGVIVLLFAGRPVAGAQSPEAAHALGSKKPPVLCSAAFKLIGLEGARNDPRFAQITGRGVAVAVIDSGLDYNHPLLKPNYLGGYNVATGSPLPTPLSGHGTHVAGIIGATDPKVAVAPGAGLLGIQVFVEKNGKRTVPDRNIRDALRWVLRNYERYNIVAVNMSLGGGSYSSPGSAGSEYVREIRELESRGVVVVSAAGNNYKKRQRPGAGVPGILSTLAVGAVWQDDAGGPFSWHGTTDHTTGADRILSFSQRPPKQFGNAIFAPGAILLSTWPGTGMKYSVGTSIASPVVSGTIALMQQAAMQYGGRFLTTEEVRQILLATADTIIDGDDEQDSVRHTNQSYPRLNAYNALKHVYGMFTGDTVHPATIWHNRNDTLATAEPGPALATTERLVTDYGVIGYDKGVRVGNTDVDLFRFEVDSRSIVLMEVSINPAAPDHFDSLLRLFDESGRELGHDDDSGRYQYSRLTAQLKPGVYFVGVSGYGNDDYDPQQPGTGKPGQTGAYSMNWRMVEMQLEPDPAPPLTPAIVQTDPPAANP